MMQDSNNLALFDNFRYAALWLKTCINIIKLEQMIKLVFGVWIFFKQTLISLHSRQIEDEYVFQVCLLYKKKKKGTRFFWDVKLQLFFFPLKKR